MRKLFQLLLVVCVSSFASATLVSNLNRVDPYFSGRVELISKLKQLLGKHHIVQINGISGIGKTALAAAYAHSSKENYDLIWWINGRSELLTQCSRFLKLLEKQTGNKVPNSILQASEDGVLAYVIDNFKGKSILLIVDDVESLTGGLLRIIQSGDRPKGLDIIITSQKALPELTSLPLESFSQSDSLELIYKFFPKAERSHALQLSAELHNFPIALCQALRYMKFYEYDIPTYLASLKKDGELLHTKEKQFIHKHKDHLSMWDEKHESADKVILKYLEDVVSSDQRLERVVYILPFLSQQYVSKDFLNGYLEFTYDNSDHQSIYGRMLESGLLMQANAGNGFYYHEIIKHMTPSDVRVRKAAAQLGSYILNMMVGQEVSNFPTDEQGNREYTDHARAYLDMCEKLGIVTEDVVKIRVLMSYYLYSVTRNLKACLKQLNLIEDSGLIEKLPKYYQALHLTRAIYTLGITGLADKKYQKFLSLWDYINNNPECKPMKLRLIGMISILLAEQQQMGEAQKYISGVDSDNLENAELYQKLAFVMAKAWCCNQMNQYQQADEATAEIWPQVKEVFHGSAKAYFAIDRSLALLKLGKYQEAEEFAKLAYHEAEIYFGGRIADIKAHSLAMLGSVYLEKKEYSKAREALEKCMALYSKLREKEGPNIGRDIRQLEAKLNFSKCLMHLKRVESALESAYEVEQAFSRLIGENAQTDFAKHIYVQIIRALWLLKRPEAAGRYIAEYDTRFGEMPDLDAALAAF